jgi:hypothetical protein
MTVEACKKAYNEWRKNVTETAINKNWRKLWFTLDGAYTVLHICSDAEESEYQILTDHVYVTLAKLMFGYIYGDTVLYGEYLLRLFRPNEKPPIDVLEKIHELASNDKEEVLIDDIKQYTLKLITSIINYIYTPY